MVINTPFIFRGFNSPTNTSYPANTYPTPPTTPTSGPNSSGLGLPYWTLDGTPTPSVPKPSVPTPSVPTPSVPKSNVPTPSAPTTPPKKVNVKVVIAVMRGDFGNGADRKKKLKEAGYTDVQIKEIQTQVNLNIKKGNIKADQVKLL